MSEQPTQSRSGDLNPTDPQDATNPATIEPDPTATDQPETDSAYGDDTDAQSDTTSLMSEVLNFKYENGRRYHSYREGEYVLPNDEAEQDRQDILHHVRNLVLDGALYRAPLKADIQRALDIGTGTGIWAIDFADQFPTAEVIGTDLSPIQPSKCLRNHCQSQTELPTKVGSHQIYHFTWTTLPRSGRSIAANLLTTSIFGTLEGRFPSGPRFLGKLMST